jgi:hypothetical protein
VIPFGGQSLQEIDGFLMDEWLPAGEHDMVGLFV